MDCKLTFESEYLKYCPVCGRQTAPAGCDCVRCRSCGLTFDRDDTDLLEADA